MSDSPTAFSRRLGKVMIVLMWLALLAMFAVLFDDFLQRQENPNQQVVSRIDSRGLAETRLQRNRYGHYVASGAINGHSVQFLLDTGASDVSVPESVAQRLALARGPAHYASTANGTVRVYATRLDSVRLGEIELRNVRASINPFMDGDDVLLGMSFLKNLELVQRGDTLTLRQY